MAASSFFSSPSYLFTLVLPRSTHKYFPILRWETPLGLSTTKPLPHEFFFYAARRAEPAPTKSARQLLRLENLNRFFLLSQGLIWVPLYLNAFPFEIGTADGVKIPGIGVKLPIPDVQVFKREEWETSWGVIKDRARRRIEVQVVQNGVIRREYYDPSPKSILAMNEEDLLRPPTAAVAAEEREAYEYLGEVW
jgi:hypothetical protein